MFFNSADRSRAPSACLDRRQLASSLLRTGLIDIDLTLMATFQNALPAAWLRATVRKQNTGMLRAGSRRAGIVDVACFDIRVCDGSPDRAPYQGA